MPIRPRISPRGARRRRSSSSRTRTSTGATTRPRAGRPARSRRRTSISRSPEAMPYARTNIKRDVEDIGSVFDGPPDLEFHAATKPLELEQSALTHQRVPPGYRFPYGHSHHTQEEVYVVVRGSGRMKVDDEVF